MKIIIRNIEVWVKKKIKSKSKSQNREKMS